MLDSRVKFSVGATLFFLIAFFLSVTFGDFKSQRPILTLLMPVNDNRTKVRSSYGPLAYLSDTFISGRTTFLPEMKISEKYVSGP